MERDRFLSPDAPEIAAAGSSANLSPNPLFVIRFDGRPERIRHGSNRSRPGLSSTPSCPDLFHCCPVSNFDAGFASMAAP